MNASTKTFLASLIILACSLGFAIGAFCFADRGFGASCCTNSSICESRLGGDNDCCQKNLDCCKKNADCCRKAADCCKKNADCCKKTTDCCQKNLDCCKKNADCCKKHFDCKHGDDCDCDNCDGQDCTCDTCKHKGKHGKRFDKKFDFKKGPGPEFMDSILQVTHEQRAALDQQRIVMDSTFKELRKQKKDAEKALHKALDSNDEKQIAAAKASILKAQEALLDHRINGVKNFNKILTKEQLEKFKSFHKDHHNKP